MSSRRYRSRISIDVDVSDVLSDISTEQLAEELSDRPDYVATAAAILPVAIGTDALIFDIDTALQHLSLGRIDQTRRILEDLHETLLALSRRNAAGTFDAFDQAASTFSHPAREVR